MDDDDCCRSCLTTGAADRPLHSLHTVCDVAGDAAALTYLDCFGWCTNLDSGVVTATDGYRPPTALCVSCLHELRAAYAFGQRCVRSDRTLRLRWQQQQQREPCGDLVAEWPADSGVTLDEDEDRLEDEQIDGADNDNDDAVGADADRLADESTQWIVETVIDDELELEVEEVVVEDGHDMDEHDDTVDVLDRSAADETDTISVVEYADVETDSETVEVGGGDPITTSSTTTNATTTTTTTIVKLSFGCVRCDAEFVSDALLRKHQSWCEAHVPGDPANPAAVAAVAATAERSRSFNMAFHCDYCGKVMNTKAGLVWHMRQEHMAPKSADFLCATCGKGFRTAQRLRVHTLTHTGERSHRCDLCPKAFATEFRLRSHRRTHTGERPYHCAVCGQMFAQGNALKCHMRLHTGERPYRCPVCARCFTQNTILKTHMALHTGKTVQCPDCDKKFARHSYLILHRREHTGEKPYACDRCPKRYMQQSHLSRHMDTHNGVRFGCDVCGKEYSKQWSLKQHMFAHGGQRPFACTVCGASFVRKDKWRDHVRKHELAAEATEAAAKAEAAEEVADNGVVLQA